MTGKNVPGKENSIRTRVEKSRILKVFAALNMNHKDLEKGRELVKLL